MQQQTYQTRETRGVSSGLANRLGVLDFGADRLGRDEMEWSAEWAERVGRNRETGILQIGLCLVDPRTGNVETPTDKHRLRLKELELLMHLFQHAFIAFTREQLLQAVWNYRCPLLTRTVDQTIATLRRKIEAAPETPRVIQTVYGIGYRLVLEGLPR
jgi:DNA-binding response OmpR family regulator